MNEEEIVNSRADRELRKKIITPGDYSLVPYEDSRCKVSIIDVNCTNEAGKCDVEAESRFLNSSFNGNLLIGDSDCFIDKDLELIIQQMCSGEVCTASLVYRDSKGALVKEISCKIELQEVMEEQLISDWGWVRLFEASTYHKERGVELVKEKRIADGFRRFNKALKMLVAIEPVDPKVIDEDRVKQIKELKVKLYNNLAHCQLQYNEYDAALQLCECALKHDPNNVKALYRRCTAYMGVQRYDEAWEDIREVLKLDPNDKAAQQKAVVLRTHINKVKTDYTNVIKKMFG